MRYQNWDVLVFPEDCKIPLQEFKTGCQVIQDPESSIYSQNGQALLPTVTCFIPGLAAGASFRVSIHCWKDPDISSYLQSISKHAENAIFEARLVIDGRLAGSKFYGRAGPWPSVLETSIELNKHGEFEPLKFPTFHQELLTQSFWNAGDDLGRIKLIIAEGFPRDSMSTPFERVRNLVSFSFQHAPLEVLEASSIAWPNASMWRQVSFTAPYLSRQQPLRQASDGIDAHSHSPRRRAGSKRASLPAPIMGPMAPPNMTAFPRQPVFDPFTEPGQNVKYNSWRHVSSSADVSMPDITSSNTRTNSSRQVTDPMITDKPDRRYETLQSIGAFETVCEALLPSVPANTPLQESADARSATKTESRKASVKRAAEPNSDAACSTAAGLKAPGLESSRLSPTVKSRKENLQDVDHASTGTEEVVRKVAQPFTKTTSSGSKRQRNVTPAASKVIDDEDEPKSSPAMRQVSRGAAKQNEKGGERRVLSGIENA